MKPAASPKASRKNYEPVDDRLLSTAGRCFIEEGFGFGIDDILAQANVAKMSLYAKFGSKYGLIEKLLELTKQEWLTEMDRIMTDSSLIGTNEVVHFVRVICSTTRDIERRTGLIGQALLEFPRTGKGDEIHKKKDLVHDKARALQKELLVKLEDFCGAARARSQIVAQQLLLLINGYLVMEPLLGKSAAMKLAVAVAERLITTNPTPGNAANNAKPGIQPRASLEGGDELPSEEYVAAIRVNRKKPRQ